MDEALEALIDKAGRDKVFALMRANGWGPYDAPPKWAWQNACHLVMQANPATPDRSTL